MLSDEALYRGAWERRRNEVLGQPAEHATAQARKIIG
jgi:hypothetical protein